MIFIKEFTKVTEDKYHIGYIHYRPFDLKYGLGKSIKELEKEGVLINTMPVLEHLPDKRAVLCWNPKTQRVFYEYEDIPKSQEELQQESMENLVQTVAKLNLENKKKDMVATTLAQTVATLNLRINKLEKEGR